MIETKTRTYDALQRDRLFGDVAYPLSCDNGLGVRVTQRGLGKGKVIEIVRMNEDGSTVTMELSGVQGRTLLETLQRHLDKANPVSFY